MTRIVRLPNTEAIGIKRSNLLLRSLIEATAYGSNKRSTLSRIGLSLKGRTGRDPVYGRGYQPLADQGDRIRFRSTAFSDPGAIAKAYHVVGAFPKTKLAALRLGIYGAGIRPPQHRGITTGYRYGRSG